MLKSIVQFFVSFFSTSAPSRDCDPRLERKKEILTRQKKARERFQASPPGSLEWVEAAEELVWCEEALKKLN